MSSKFCNKYITNQNQINALSRKKIIANTIRLLYTKRTYKFLGSMCILLVLFKIRLTHTYVIRAVELTLFESAINLEMTRVHKTPKTTFSRGVR
jgi:hypothetical protein